jgi:hypothetical protein
VILRPLARLSDGGMVWHRARVHAASTALDIQTHTQRLQIDRSDNFIIARTLASAD